MKTLIKRWKAESSTWFKKMITYALMVLGSAASLLVAHETQVIDLESYHLFGRSLLSICKHLAEISTVVAIVAKTSAKPEVPNQTI